MNLMGSFQIQNQFVRINCRIEDGWEPLIPRKRNGWIVQQFVQGGADTQGERWLKR